MPASAADAAGVVLRRPIRRRRLTGMTSKLLRAAAVLLSLVSIALAADGPAKRITMPKGFDPVADALKVEGRKASDAVREAKRIEAEPPDTTRLDQLTIQDHGRQAAKEAAAEAKRYYQPWGEAKQLRMLMQAQPIGSAERATIQKQIERAEKRKKGR